MKSTSSSFHPSQIELDTKCNAILDDRFSAFNVKLPVNYYLSVSKDNEPNLKKDWFIRPHHIETYSESAHAIPDDVLNTKYISYYGPSNPEKREKTRQEVIEELLEETRTHISKLKADMYRTSGSQRTKDKMMQKLEKVKEEAKKEYKPGMYIDVDKKGNIKDILSQENNTTSYSEMFNSNNNIQQINLTIDACAKMLEELRKKERDILNIKRRQEYERIRPPVKNWFELRGAAFQNEMQRNKMVINAKPEYFRKIKQLQNEELY